MCLEISGNLPQALEEIQKALITEPYNPDYLFAAAVINFNMKNYELTSMYLSEVRIIEPDLPRLSELEELLRNSLLQ
jgi:tetratricopeptide (TPR) repeat protein